MTKGSRNNIKMHLPRFGEYQKRLIPGTRFGSRYPRKVTQVQIFVSNEGLENVKRADALGFNPIKSDWRITILHGWCSWVAAVRWIMEMLALSHQVQPRASTRRRVASVPYTNICDWIIAASTLISIRITSHDVISFPLLSRPIPSPGMTRLKNEYAS